MDKAPAEIDRFPAVTKVIVADKAPPTSYTPDPVDVWLFAIAK